MASEPPRIRKPMALPRRGRSASARPSAPVPPALISAGIMLVLGGVGWWLLQGPPAAPEPEALPEITAEVKNPAASPVKSGIAATPPPAPAPLPETEGKPANPIAGPAPSPTAVVNPFEKLLVLDALGAAKKENTVWIEEAWQLALKTGPWDAYRDLLARSLQAFTGKGTDTKAVVAGQWSGPALIRHAFLGAVPSDTLKSLLSGEKTRPFTQWLLDHPEAMQAFTLQLTPQDDVAKALKIWALIAEEHPKALTGYQELAIACSLVFDRTIKISEDRYGATVDAVSRYRHFEENGEADRLAVKIKKMTAAELVWVVGVPVSSKELEWAVKKAGFRQKSWGQAYGTIKYDMEKAVTGKNAYDEYTFSEIQKKGGICGDQSYFTAWTACANGVPAAIISGDGARGPHAWITWMADEGEWQFSGRFGGYPAGHSVSPQTGATISEEEFVRLGDRKASSPEIRLKAQQALWLAGVFANNPDKALACISDAVKMAPRLAGPSTALLTHWTLHRADAKVEEWADLFKDLRKNFRDCAPLMAGAAAAEQKFVFARQETAATIKDLRREARKVEDTSGTKKGVAADLDRLTGGLRRQAEVLQASKDSDGIRSLYRRALADYGDDAATFKALAKDYFAFFKTDSVQALKACHELESACRRSVGRGKGDWFDVLSQNSAWQVVASCYRSAGDEAKASLIVRDCDAREKAAKTKAI